MDSLLFKEIQSHNSKHYNYLNILMIATLYENQVFYIPTFLDFRGRLYSKVQYLNYQAGDMARSLIQFYSPKDNINKYKDTDNPYRSPINYLKQYAGNVYNLSKKTHKMKIEWCNNFIEDLKTEFKFCDLSNISNIESQNVEVLSSDKEVDTRMSDTTLVGRKKQDFDFDFLNKYLDNAEEPFQFIAAYYAIKDIIINKQYYINIPILFDASCSGVQHLASIACDLKVARMVNVVNTKHVRSDFYQIAADYVVEMIKNMELDSDNKENLKLIKVTRSILKVPIMTISYNVGLTKMSKNLLSEMGKLVEIDKDNLIVTETENKNDININLHKDSPELAELVAIPVSLEGVRGEKETNLKNSSGNRTFKIKINKEQSKIEEDLFLSPKE